MRGSTLWTFLRPIGDVWCDGIMRRSSFRLVGSCDGLRSDWWDLKRARDPGKYGVKVDPRRRYKRSPLDAVNHSRLALDTVMTHRILDARDVKEIIEDLKQQLNLASEILARLEEGEKPLHVKIFDLELRLVSPLYYRLQRHLIDWGDRSCYPHLSGLEITKRADREGKKFNEFV